MPSAFFVSDILTTSNDSNQYRRRSRRIAGNISSTADDTTPNKKKHNTNKKKNFATASFRNLGCTASSQVSVPASIRSSANWEAKKVSKRNQRTAIDDLWCVPAIALSSTTDVDFDKKKKKKKNKKKKNERSSSSSSTRRMMTQETVLFQDSRFGLTDEFRPRSFHHHVPTSPSLEGISEIGMIQNRRLLNGARIGGLDQYEEWRLNVDNMTYEDLLELGERIGYVNTGLKEEDIIHCLRKLKISRREGQEEDLLTESDRNCSICQEEYGEEDETGKLDCGHFFHSHCIEQWLVRKNSCPICKTAAIAE
ncbi:uncharacterized protein LOC124942472 [Impatiens glandulifera]|uniref:uncharacterized protein LOC124942472 n=1 Tax=Impatiens glandulifera TaxID=253017 RepID=UPI001FB0E2CB|nr:uncharacterized protein LOC124942472 [Impatiens glandulifera]